MNRWCLLLSVGLHVASLLWVSYSPVTTKKPKPPPVYTPIVDVELLAREENYTDIEMHLNCPDTYEGIGIRFYWDGTVSEVAKGWPGDRAGIKVGDYIPEWHDMEPKDGYMEFTLTRGNKTVKMKLKTQRVCQRKVKT